jgi:RNA polymerase sigma factor (sigma-70 family)
MDDERRRVTVTTDRVHEAWVAHHERLWRSVLAWSGDRELASDAVAEAFAQAARRGGAVDDVGRWVWAAAFRIGAGLLADRRRRYDGGMSPAIDTAATGLPEDGIALVSALAELTADDRTIVVLSLVGGWSSAEVAELVDSTPGTVRVRLHRAKARLRTLLEVHDA